MDRTGRYPLAVGCPAAAVMVADLVLRYGKARLNTNVTGIRVNRLGRSIRWTDFGVGKATVERAPSLISYCQVPNASKPSSSGSSDPLSVPVVRSLESRNRFEDPGGAKGTRDKSSHSRGGDCPETDCNLRIACSRSLTLSLRAIFSSCAAISLLCS